MTLGDLQNAFAKIKGNNGIRNAAQLIFDALGDKGDVSGPATSTDFAFPMWDGTTGKLLKDSAVTSDAVGTILATHTASFGGESVCLRLTSNYGGGTPSNGFGEYIQFMLESSTTNGREAGRIAVTWSDVTDASRTAYMSFWLVNSAGAAAEKMRLFPSGGLSVNSTTDPGAGVINANSGFAKGGTEFPIASNGLVQRTGANTYTAKTAPAGTVVGTSDTQTLGNKRINPRSSAQSAITSLTPDISSFDCYVITGLTAGLTINAPTGSPVNDNRLIFTISDNGTSRSLTWNAIFKGTLPAATTVGSTNVVEFVFANTQWRCVANQIS